jgi:hypothetical protein
MEVANTLAYYKTATIAAVKVLTVSSWLKISDALGVSKIVKRVVPIVVALGCET